MPDSPKTEKYQGFLSDAPMVGDGGRVTLSKEIRDRTGWPAQGRLEIIIELISDEWIELHLETHVTERLARARSIPDKEGHTKRDKDRLRQAVDAVLIQVTYNPNESRIDLPATVLAHLGIHPQPHQPRSIATNREKPRGSRYCGQQVYVQAGEGYITITSLAREKRRAQETQARLNEDVKD